MNRLALAIVLCFCSSAVLFAQPSRQTKPGRMMTVKQVAPVRTAVAPQRQTVPAQTVNSNTPAPKRYVYQQPQYTRPVYQEYGSGDFKRWELSLGPSYTKTAGSLEDVLGGKIIDKGVTGGISAYYYVQNWLGLGLSTSYTGFAEHENVTNFLQPGGTSAQIQAHYSDFKRYDLSFSAKLRVNPSSPVKVYFPLGMGISHLKGTESVYGYNPMAGAISFGKGSGSRTGLSLFAGVGMDVDLSDSVFLGLEYRYTYDCDDLSDWMTDAQSVVPSFHNFGMRIGFRF